MVTYNIVGNRTTHKRRVYGTLKVYSPLAQAGYIKLNLINRYQSMVLRGRNKRIADKIITILLEEGYALEDLSITSKYINKTTFRKKSRIMVKE